MNENPHRNLPNTNEFKTIVLAIKIVIIAVILIPVTRYVLVSNNNSNENNDEVTGTAPSSTDVTRSDILQTQNISISSHSNTDDDEVELSGETQPAVTSSKPVRKRIVVQPTCPSAYILVILQDICMDLQFKNAFCTSEDVNDVKKHKVPDKIIVMRKPSKEAKVPAIINYAVGGLLIFSLGAALVELYKAKKNPSKKDGKNPLSRKCSLADLTVLKHHRKELVRRESIMEEENNAGSTMTSSSRQAGLRPPPLRRRCSFPVGPLIVPLLDGRPATVIDQGRRESLAIDARTQSVVVVDGAARRMSLIPSSTITSSVSSSSSSPPDGRRRMSLCGEESPERRHHSRLVHRH